MESLDQINELLRAGVWLGPAVLGSQAATGVQSVAADAGFSLSAEQFAGVVMLSTAAVILTIAGIKFSAGKQALFAPAAFAAMFAVSWFVR